MIDLVEIPAVFCEAVEGCHVAGAVAAAGTVDVEYAGVLVIDGLEEGGDVVFGRIAFVADGDVDVTHTGGFDSCLLAVGIVR